MSRQSIFNVDAVRATVNDVQLQNIIAFLIKYRSMITIADTKQILSARSLIETPISSLYQTFVDTGKDRLFGFIKILPEMPHPEAITYPHLDFDTKQLTTNYPELFQAICVAPEFANKIVYNITTLLKRNNELNNTTAFQSLFVRDILSRSFYTTNDLWLTPSTIQYLCKTYSMSIAVAIGSVFGLTFTEIQIITTIFALYFLQQVSSSTVAEIMLKNATRYIIGLNIDTAGTIEKIKLCLGDNYTKMTFDDAFKCLSILNIGRLNDVNRRFVSSRMKNMGPDVNTTLIALDYPPYWAYLVFYAASGNKVGLSHFLKKYGLLKDMPKIAFDLSKNQSFLNTIT